MTQKKHTLTQRGEAATAILVGILGNQAFCKSVAGEAQCQRQMQSMLVTEAFDIADLVMVADEHGVEAIEYSHPEEADEASINNTKMRAQMHAFLDSLAKARGNKEGAAPTQDKPAPEKDREPKIHIISGTGSFEDFLMQAFNRQRG